MEVLLEHGDIVVSKSVVEGQVAVVVDNVRSRSDLIYDRVLPVDAHDVLNCLSFVVLLTTGHEKSVVTTEPVEDVFVSVSCAFEKRIFSQVVPILRIECLVLMLSEYLEHL